MDYARRSRRFSVLPRSGQSEEQADCRIGFDMISSVNVSRVTASAAAGPQRAETLPQRFLPPSCKQP
jgi:hypothetical protein